MKNIIHNLTRTFSILILITGCAQKVDTTLERDNLRNADTEWSNTFATKNIDEFAATIDENGVLLSPNTPIITGKEAIRQWASGLLALPGFAIHWKPSTVEVSKMGDLGYTIGSYEMSFNDAEGNLITDRGKYVTVWKKYDDGKWKVVSDIFNSDLQIEP